MVSDIGPTEPQIPRFPGTSVPLGCISEGPPPCPLGLEYLLECLRDLSKTRVFFKERDHTDEQPEEAVHWPRSGSFCAHGVGVHHLPMG